MQKKHNLEMIVRDHDEPKQLLTDEDNRLESNRSPNVERVVSESTFKEVTVNLDSSSYKRLKQKELTYPLHWNNSSGEWCPGP